MFLFKEQYENSDYWFDSHCPPSATIIIEGFVSGGRPMLQFLIFLITVVITISIPVGFYYSFLGRRGSAFA